jgi:hypothetical protein
MISAAAARRVCVYGGSVAAISSQRVYLIAGAKSSILGKYFSNYDFYVTVLRLPAGIRQAAGEK